MNQLTSPAASAATADPVDVLVRAAVLGGPDVRGLDGNTAADALARSVSAIVAAEIAQVELVAHWADLHDPATRPDLSGEVLAERRVRPGADGTPRVTEFAAAEVGVVLGVTTTTAQGLLRDVLDCGTGTHCCGMRSWSSSIASGAARCGSRASDRSPSSTPPTCCTTRG